jgi:hypothetical protein
MALSANCRPRARLAARTGCGTRDTANCAKRVRDPKMTLPFAYLILNRQDAKNTKMFCIESETCSSWRPWRPGG